jgi:glyoxylase-like metal-dependent hydrolase (beta-lactamase superfamily II)
MDFFNIPLLIHPNDFRRRKLEKVKYIQENDVVEIGSEKLHVIDAPGHTSGGIMLISYSNKIIFTGDTLLRGKLPRQLVDLDELITSIRKIMSYPMVTDNFEIYPGHGRKSTIGEEKLHNEFNEFNKSKVGIN